MKKLLFKKIWLTLGYIAIAAIWYLSLMHNPPQIIESLPMEDKGSHFSGYFAISLWFFQLYEANYFKIVAPLFILMGIIIEFLQAYGGYRSFEYYDMLANSIGVIVALLFARFLSHQLLVKLEAKIRDR